MTSTSFQGPSELECGCSKATSLELHTICDFLEELAPSKPSGVRLYRDLIEFVNDRPGHDRRYALDTSKIEMELGWCPEKSFKEGLLSTVKWYLENNNWWEDILCKEEKFNQGSN